MPRDEAWAILTEHTTGESLRQHALAAGAAMRHLARQAGEHEETWAIPGSLHDFDYEKDPSQHPQRGKPILEQAGVPGHVVHAIQTHGDHLGIPRVTAMEKTLYAVDELTGFIAAVALVRPSKRVADVDAAAVRKKMKDKAFARAVSRESLLQGAADLGVEFEDLVGEVVVAMTREAGALGLAGASSG